MFSLINRLDLKLIFWTSLLTILITIAYSIYKIPKEQNILIKQMDAQAKMLTYAISKAAIGPILYQDYPALQQLVESLIEKESSVAFIRIKLTDDKKTVVEESSSSPSSLSLSSKNEQVRTYHRDIKINSDQDYILGTVEIGMYKTIYEMLINEHIWSLIIALGLMLLIKILTQIILIAKTVTHPLRDLVRQAKNLGDGDLTTSITLTNKDELGHLAEALDDMRLKLKVSHVSKDYMDNIIRSMMDMLIVLNPDGTIKYVNQALNELLKYKDSEIINQPFSKIIYKNEGEAEISSFIEKLLETGSMDQLEKTFITKDGNKIPVLFSGSVMLDAHKKIQGIVCTGRDITEMKLMLLKEKKLSAKAASSAKEAQKRAKELHIAHDKLKETQAQLVQNAKLASLGVMSSGLAHELNNPLQFIMGFNERMKAYFETNELATFKDVENYISKISKNCDRMKKIIQYFRDFSRQTKQNFKPTSINDTISNSFILFKEQLRLRNIKIELYLSRNDPQINGNNNRLEQVFTNLISNSRDAITSVFPLEGGLLRVSSKVENNSVILDFSDNGTGIEKSKIDRIFDPFYTTKEVGKGTGLGLSISFGIIREHKGNINCLNTSKEGTTFRIKLPIYKNDEKTSNNFKSSYNCEYRDVIYKEELS